MNTKIDEIEKLESEISKTRLLIDKHTKKLTAMIKKKDKLVIEENRDNYTNMEWLIKNPSLPGSHKAMDAFFETRYSGVWEGVHPDGYYHLADGVSMQKNFSLICNIYYHESSNTESKRKDNIVDFMENFLKFLEPTTEISSRYSDEFPTVKVVTFSFNSSQRGINLLGYEPLKKEWYYYTLTYGTTDIKKCFGHLKEALDFAFDYCRKNSDG